LIERTPDLQAGDLRDEQREVWARMMATDDLTVYLSETNGEAIGTTALLVMPHLTYDCRPTAFVEPMYVRDDHRRQGVARSMLKHLLDGATAAGCHKVQLLAHKRHADDGAHDLYRSTGFVSEAEGFRLYLDPR
jgi:GNAT superfamily N-acetyltransferase